MNAPWLFAEAYKYRRLRECFSLSKYFVEYGKLVHELYVVEIRLDLVVRRLFPSEMRHLLSLQPSCLRAFPTILRVSGH